ncbi:sensor histidine kinase [Pseudoalteromonas sp. NJ631]|uniref:sensor histidine kinase n=1 Tax=Pseudoalteromonas sp. NJ631 TaxID=493915 RepID=UPI0002D3027A|nr:HAMP domain-containing sensor histidine kinase [Pseudoalteromonas sp. NJ631]
MVIFKNKTLEGYITFWLSLATLLFLSVLSLLLLELNLSNGMVLLSTTVVALLSFVSIARFRAQVTSSFNRSLLHIDALRLEDYKQYAKPRFPLGVVGKFHQQLREFSEDLAKKKQRYDQHAFLVYRLIDQLDTPVLVFDHKNQLTYANGAFGYLYKDKSWQRYRYASPKRLGLIEGSGGWQLEQNNQQWQISQSTFIDANVAHKLLVFTNIEAAIRNSQTDAWKQIISVIGHEIRNSLTPVCSIAENLAERASSERDSEALALISDRCLHLQDFINRYASLSKQINLHYQSMSAQLMADRLLRLFPEVDITPIVVTKWIWADQSLLEQVLINIIKNAHEANANQVSVEFVKKGDKTIIRVVDNGHGFANIGNLFVPLFTTKQDGQGIGLSFCRNIIEQHQGSIDLANNEEKGVTITISLPLKPT